MKLFEHLNSELKQKEGIYAPYYFRCLGYREDLSVDYSSLRANGIYSLFIKSKPVILKSEWIVRYQLDIPLIGVIFAPEFGQSYYEISLGHTDGIVSIAHPLNNPSWRHMLSLDIPLHIKHRSTTLRLSYIADLYQSKINYIRCHMYHHAFTFGFVKTIFKIKRENNLKAYSPY